MATIRFTKKQEEEIEKSPLSKSEFVRRAVDMYILYLKDPYTHTLLNELSSWIKEKRVIHISTNVSDMNTNVLKENTDVIHMNTNVSDMNTTHEKKTQDTLQKVLQNELPMIQRLLQNPENSDSIPDCTLKLLSKKYNLSKGTIQGWIVENKDWIKSSEF
jgi:hypothetical protein